MQEQVILAARNNALWCDGMCRAHGVPSRLADGLWLCESTPPRFHSQATTLQPGQAGLLRERWPLGFKDGFGDVDAAPWGGTVLFRAHWIWSEASEPVPGGMDCRRVQTDEELLIWEAGWAHGDDEASRYPRQFPPSLLDDPDNVFVGIWREGRLAAGGILNRTGPVVGISNTFAIEIDLSELWHELVRCASDLFSGLPLTGYERDGGLDAAEANGFRRLSELRVWVP